MDAEETFFAALDQPALPERQRFVDRACGNDKTLRTQVETLLRSHHEEESFLDFPLLETTATLEQPASAMAGAEELRMFHAEAEQVLSVKKEEQ